MRCSPASPPAGLRLAGLIVVHADDHPLYTGLVHGAALAVLILSVVVGTTTMGLNATRRFDLARYTAAVAVALVVADWAFARWPTLLPGLTVDQAAAPHDTMVAVVVAVLAGGVLLFPALALLFSLTLRGRLGADGEEPEPMTTAGQRRVAELLLDRRSERDSRCRWRSSASGCSPWLRRRGHTPSASSACSPSCRGVRGLVPRALAEDA